MTNLILPSLEIQNFRTFEHLRIERFGRVNLITGKNNVGKSALLEAVYLYANNGNPLLLRELLDARDELQANSENSSGIGRTRTTSIDPNCIRHLFYGRKTIKDDVAPVSIGPINERDKTLTMMLRWFHTIEQPGDEEPMVRRLIAVEPDDLMNNPEARPYLTNLMGTKTIRRSSLENILQSQVRYSGEPQGVHNGYVKVNGLNNRQIAQLWDNIALTPLEEDIISALRIIAPKIMRVNIIGERDDARKPVPIVVMSGQQERVPLRSLGEGINRLFGMALSLVNVQNGVLLLDEPDNGLHYSVLPEVWRLIFQLAYRLNVQVFATTHSWDCIQAFEHAARDENNEEGILVHLLNKNDRVIATHYDEHELNIATRELIEVR